MVFSAESFGAELAVVVVAGVDVDVGSVVDEQPAINMAMHAASPTHRVREPIIVVGSFWVIHDVDYVAIRGANEEAADAPRLSRDRMDDLVAEFLGLCIRSFDVICVDGDD